MSPGHCEYCVFVTPLRSSCEQGFWCICVNAHMNAILLQVLQVQESHSTAWFPVQGSPCLSGLACVNALYVWTFLFQWATDPTSYPVSSLFRISQFQSLLWPCPGCLNVWIACILSYFSFWPFCRSRVNTVLYFTQLCHLQPILYKVCNSSILARGSLFFPGNTVLIFVLNLLLIQVYVQLYLLQCEMRLWSYK